MTILPTPGPPKGPGVLSARQDALLLPAPGAAFSARRPHTRRGGYYVKSNMVYRLCNNMVYTFALQPFFISSHIPPAKYSSA